MLFLLAGSRLGTGVLDLIPVRSGNPVVKILAEPALFSVLFTDGMPVGFADLRSAWHLTGRALLLGLPLTLAVTAVLAHYVTRLPWLKSFLLGGTGTGGWQLAEEITLGIVVAILVPLIVLRLERLPFLQAQRGLQPLLTVSIGLLVLAICQATHANLFLGAFAAGITVASYGPEFSHEFQQFGELVTELLKPAAILVFGALITPDFLFREIPLTGWIFAVLALVFARPLALLASFPSSRLPRPSRWPPCGLGPKARLGGLRAGRPRMGHQVRRTAAHIVEAEFHAKLRLAGVGNTAEPACARP